MDNKNSIPLAIILAGVLIAGAVYFGGRVPSQPAAGIEAQASSDASLKVVPVSASDHIRGNANAELTIIEYSDLECPFCKVFHGTMQEIMNDYDGKVAWVYRQFPIPQLHSKAPKESEASECAAELGGNTAFWNFIDEVFATTGSNDSLDPAELPKIAGDIGLDVSAFNTCLSSGKYASAIEKSSQEAVEAGALGTPYSIIVSKSGKKVVINGAEPIESVKAKIDSLLAE